MWFSTKVELRLTFLLLILTTPKCSSSPVNDDIPKARQSRAFTTASVNEYKLYDTLTTNPTLGVYLQSMLGTAYTVIGWFIVTISWTFSGLSSIEESIFDYDYVGRIVNHYTDPQTAGFRIAINMGGQIFGSIILMWFTLFENNDDDVLARKKRHVGHHIVKKDLHDDGFDFVEESLGEDRMDQNCDSTCEFYQNLYTIMDNTFKYQNVIIPLCNNLVFLAGKTIFWNILAILPDPEIIVESFEAL